MVTDTSKIKYPFMSNTTHKKELINKANFETYNIRIIAHEPLSLDKSTNLFLISEKIIFIFLLLFIYLFVALEEIDHQIFLASNKHDRSEEEVDKWSVWRLLKKEIVLEL